MVSLGDFIGQGGFDWGIVILILSLLVGFGVALGLFFYIRWRKSFNIRIEVSDLTKDSNKVYIDYAKVTVDSTGATKWQFLHTRNSNNSRVMIDVPDSAFIDLYKGGRYARYIRINENMFIPHHPNVSNDLVMTNPDSVDDSDLKEKVKQRNKLIKQKLNSDVYVNSSDTSAYLTQIRKADANRHKGVAHYIKMFRDVALILVTVIGVVIIINVVSGVINDSLQIQMEVAQLLSDVSASNEMFVEELINFLEGRDVAGDGVAGNVSEVPN